MYTHTRACAHTQITLQSTVRTMAHLFTLRKFNRPSSRRTPAGSPFSLLLPPGYASLRSWVDWLIRAPTGWGWGQDGRSPVPPDNQRQSKGSRKATSPAKAPTFRSGLCSSCKSQCKVPTCSRDYLGRSRLEVTFWFSTRLTQLQHRISAVSRSHPSRLLTPDSIQPWITALWLLELTSLLLIQTAQVWGGIPGGQGQGPEPGDSNRPGRASVSPGETLGWRNMGISSTRVSYESWVNSSLCAQNSL